MESLTSQVSTKPTHPMRISGAQFAADCKRRAQRLEEKEKVICDGPHLCCQCSRVAASFGLHLTWPLPGIQSHVRVLNGWRSQVNPLPVAVLGAVPTLYRACNVYSRWHQHRCLHQPQGGFRIQRDSDSAGCPNVVCSHCQASFRQCLLVSLMSWPWNADALCRCFVVARLRTFLADDGLG